MKNMILLSRTVGAVLILSAFNMPVHAAVTEAWVHRYRNNPDYSDSGPLALRWIPHDRFRPLAALPVAFQVR